MSVQRDCPNFSEWKNTTTGEIRYVCDQGVWDSEMCTPECAAPFKKARADEIQSTDHS